MIPHRPVSRVGRGGSSWPFSRRPAGSSCSPPAPSPGCSRRPSIPALILRQIVYIGYFSLPVVGLTALFTGMVLALQSYTGFSRFNAESAIATVVVLSGSRANWGRSSPG